MLFEMITDARKIPATSLLEALKSHLARCGLDLVQPFAAQQYNTSLPALRASIPLPLLPTFQLQKTFSVVIGNSKVIWEPFIRSLQNESSLDRDPFDRYVSQCLDRVLKETMDLHSGSFTIRYSYSSGQEFVHFLHLAHLSGLAYWNKVPRMKVIKTQANLM